ncbi:MAG: hypothetical protein OSJ74_00150 [Clostridia bacterium]|nr:hypothetical protein [Clostridia bacterium]
MQQKKNAELLVNAGYGDVKQAVKEFAERLRESFLRNVFINGDVNVRGKWYTSKEVIREIIDELVKEVCGEWTN